MPYDDKLSQINRDYLDACSDGNLPGVQAAIEAGADPFVRGDKLETGLHRSATHDNTEVMAYLLDQIGLPKNARDENEETASHWAAKSNCVAPLDMLADRGADLSLPDGRGLNPFLTADLHDAPDTKQYLQDRGCDKAKTSPGFAARFADQQGKPHGLRVIDTRANGEQSQPSRG